jgi:CheY-like chemotaxis protein/HPt (histidine-containing phosphotransfer) domain-containing protein
VALGLLRKLGLRVDAVADGAEAVRALESIPYDLVLMDMRMPVMDGVEAARQIRNPQSAVLHHDIPIIALTANAMQSDRLNCLAAGMNDFVPKPIMQGVLRDVLQKWLPAGDSETPNAANPFKPVQMNEKDVKVFDPVSVWSRLEGDNELVKIVFEAFLADIPSQIEALKELVKRGDRAGAALQAHSIRGASASVGGESLRKLAAQMEKAADSGDWRLVVTRMDELERQFNLLKSAIEADRPVCMK